MDRYRTDVPVRIRGRRARRETAWLAKERDRRPSYQFSATSGRPTGQGFLTTPDSLYSRVVASSPPPAVSDTVPLPVQASDDRPNSQCSPSPVSVLTRAKRVAAPVAAPASPTSSAASTTTVTPGARLPEPASAPAPARSSAFPVRILLWRRRRWRRGSHRHWCRLLRLLHGGRPDADLQQQLKYRSDPTTKSCGNYFLIVRPARTDCGRWATPSAIRRNLSGIQ